MASNFSFKRGWRQLPNGKLKEAKIRIMEALKLKYETSFYPRLNGDIEPKFSEVKSIEDIFHSYGVTDIWGE